MATVVADGFLASWLNFPDELKLKVLQYVLPSGTDLYSTSFTPNSDFGRDLAFYATMRPILACPCLAPLGLEVLYKQNTLNLGAVRPDKAVMLPPAPVRKYVRSMDILVTLEEFGSKQFRDIAEGRLGFPIMDRMKVYVCDWLRFSSNGVADTANFSAATVRERLEAMEPLPFHAKEVCVYYEPENTRTELDDIDIALWEKVGIVGRSAGVQRVLERRLITRHNPWGSSIDLVREWPAVVDRKKHSRETMMYVRR